MIVRLIVTLLAIAFVQAAFANEESPAPQPTPTPGLWHRILHPFHKDKKAPEEKKLVLAVVFSPQPVKLSQGRELQVTLVLTNKTGKFVQLAFPTTQRIEVLLRNGAGKMVTQWSEEQTFANDPGYVAINPNESVQYTAHISGRDLVAGKPYTIEGFFPNYENLRATKSFVPEK
jgi:hypothetical protein